MSKKYEVIFTKRARRKLRKMDPDIRKQIIDAATRLEDNPRPQSAKRLKGPHKGLWRERTGNYRIVYEIKEQKLLVRVVRLGHRKDIYR
jgi:mRNA interferase RelE/StbE